MGKLSRGLALMLVVFGGIYAGLGQILSVSRGPATTGFEALRRFTAALNAMDYGRAAALGVKAIAPVNADKRWSASDRAAIEYRVATANNTAGNSANALALARMANRELSNVADADRSLVINVAELHGDLALSSGDKLEAACTFGLALERLGPDRVAHPEQRLRPDPSLETLTGHLLGLGKSFAATPVRPLAIANSPPLTSCNLTADFFAERKDYAAAASISEAVLAQADHETSLGPEIRAGLLQDAAHIAELNGQVDLAKTRAEKAVKVLSGSGLSAPRVVALETLATLHTNWSDAKGAEPYLQESLKLREQLNGSNSPELISPLLALGYAQLDTKDAAGAESLFKRALSIADSKSVKDASASLEATLALAELYDNQSRSADAISMHSKAAALQKAGITLRGADVEDVPIVEPSAKQRLALLDIPYLTGLTGGKVTVGLSAGRDAVWAGAWPERTFTPSSERFSTPLVYQARETGNAAAQAASLFFVPGQGTEFSINAGRLAKLQAMLGPGERPLLVNWSNGDAATESFRSGYAEAQGARALANALSRASLDRSAAPITLIAEGRGAFVMMSALDGLSPAQRAVIDKRLQHLILLAPDIDAASMTAELAHVDRGHTQTIVYAAKTARPLLASAAIYGSHPIGLDPEQLSRLAGVETVEVGIGTDWTDFTSLWSSSLIEDMTHTIRDGSIAVKRCGISRMDTARGSERYVLKPHGCALAAAD